MLRDLRKEIGATQKEVAEKCGVTQGYISMIESGKKKNMSLDVLINIAAALRVSTDTIINECRGSNDEAVS